jgi:hypothetical protein
MSTKKLINWPKRQLIAATLTEVRDKQNSSYDFPVVEPINTYLTELAHLDGMESFPLFLLFIEKELYDLSLLREPRNAELKDLM